MAIDLTDDRTRVLICDDQERDLNSITLTLNLFNRRINVLGTATSGAKLMTLAKRVKHFDVAIVDLSMPRLDGLETAHRLKEQFPNSKVIILTAHDERRDEIEASPDVDGYCSKIEVETIDQRIAEVMGQADPEPEPARGGFVGRLFRGSSL
jgi:DNA-binding NarL/FixJ family response regulator